MILAGRPHEWLKDWVTDENGFTYINLNGIWYKTKKATDKEISKALNEREIERWKRKAEESKKQYEEAKKEWFRRMDEEEY